MDMEEFSLTEWTRTVQPSIEVLPLSLCPYLSVAPVQQVTGRGTFHYSVSGIRISDPRNPPTPPAEQKMMEQKSNSSHSSSWGL